MADSVQGNNASNVNNANSASSVNNEAQFDELMDFIRSMHFGESFVRSDGLTQTSYVSSVPNDYAPLRGAIVHGSRGGRDIILVPVNTGKHFMFSDLGPDVLSRPDGLPIATEMAYMAYSWEKDLL